LVAAGAFVALVVAGCGSSRQLVLQQSKVGIPPIVVDVVSATANKQKTQAEAERLLQLAVVPPGSVELDGAPSSLLSGPVMGTPMTTSLVDDSSWWRVPTSMTSTLAWFVGHPPGGLARSGSGSSSSYGAITSSGDSYDAPSSAAWTGASVEIGVAPMGPDTSVVRVDGLAIWIDPIPVRDNQPGPGMRVAVASGCPAGDRGFVGVTNPPPPLDRSLLPAGTPNAGLVCEYYGMNGHPFALKEKTTLNQSAADALAVKVQQLTLGHIDGEVVNCPMDDGSAAVVALVYPDGQNLDLWITTNGCTDVSNGYISAGGSVLPDN
jgi:hypothetical protein